MSEPTCSQCRHWCEMPPPQPGLLLNREKPPRMGQCREGPPQMTMVQTQQGMVQVVDYPVLPQQFPACGHFAATPPSR